MDRLAARLTIVFLVSTFCIACSDGPGSEFDTGATDTEVRDTEFGGCSGLDRSTCGNTRGCRWVCGACESGDADAAGVTCDTGVTDTADAEDAADAGDTTAADIDAGDVDESTEHFEWVRYNDGEFGPSAYTDITTGPEGALYLAGVVQGPPDKPTPDDVAPSGIVVKLDADGTYRWAHLVDSSDATRLTALEVDDSGTVYAVGWGGRGADHTSILLELTSEGDLENRHEILASGTARTKELDLLDEDLVVAGDAEDFDDPAGDGQDAFIARLAPDTGDARWTTMLGGDDMDSARSLVLRDAGEIRVSIPVVSEAPDDPVANGKLYAITGDGGINGANSLPLPEALFDVGLQGDDIFLGGNARKTEPEHRDAFVAGGTPVYPTVRFNEDFGTDGDDFVTDLAIDEDPAAWYVGRHDLDNEDGTSEAFVVRYTREGEQTHEMIFGDKTDAGTDPRAVTVDDQGRIYVAGGTQTRFGDNDEFAAQATFVGQLRPDNGS